MRKTKIGFIGYGVVGSATRVLLTDYGHKDFGIYDPDLGHTREADLDDCSVVFISVPVPTNSDGTQNLSILKEALGRCPRMADVFIRSSVLPETAKCLQHDRPHLNIYALPEFLTERTAEKDVRTLPLVCSVPASNVLRELMPGKKMLVLPDEDNCEFVKYIHNGFCAVKVAYFNTIYKIAEEIGLDYTRSVGAACNVTGFIEETHTKVPGPDGKLGFGGKCLPKDLFALAKYVEQMTEKETFLKSILNENFYNRFGALF